jgi:Peptidase MA superfamily
MSRWRLPALTLAVALICRPSAIAAQPRPPELQFEASADAPASAAIGRVDQEHLRTIVRLVGLEDPGGPIRVILAREDTDVARTTPSWIAGVAHGPSDTILLFPSRSPRYPHDSLAAVLHHEIAHVLIHRAAHGQPIPRWFNEGLATVAERAWNFEDRRQLAWALAARSPVSMRDVDAAFQQGPEKAARAYALGSAFIRDVIDRHGIDAPARILRHAGPGTSFDHAFEQAVGESLDDAERVFSVEVTSWERWIPLLTSPFVLWTATTLLALYAMVVFRLRRAEHRRRWEDEADQDAVPDGDDDGVGPEVGNDPSHRVIE